MVVFTLALFGTQFGNSEDNKLIVTLCLVGTSQPGGHPGILCHALMKEECVVPHELEETSCGIKENKVMAFYRRNFGMGTGVTASSGNR